MDLNDEKKGPQNRLSTFAGLESSLETSDAAKLATKKSGKSLILSPLGNRPTNAIYIREKYSSLE